uniref:Intracellular growth attenuator family protein n=1 Tax=Elaeophora elaphi TaxID=1147741 RepID=A0A0R3S196_9BILA
MKEETINKYLLIFTFTAALIALAILLFIFLKDKLCPRRNLYARHSDQAVSQQNELTEILHDTPNKILLRSDGSIPVDLPDLDYIDERSVHLVSPTIVVHSLKNSPVAL